MPDAIVVFPEQGRPVIQITAGKVVIYIHMIGEKEMI
jgi:hypothetical protein